jgi:hypothetical protein
MRCQRMVPSPYAATTNRPSPVMLTAHTALGAARCHNCLPSASRARKHPLGAEDETVSVGMDREAQRVLPLGEFYFRVIRFEQIFQPILPCGSRAVIRGPLIGRLEGVEVEAERGFAEPGSQNQGNCRSVGNDP